MPHSVDDSALVPKPPPPRPARRDAAIDAALRRFDGVEEAPAVAPAKARLAWRARPQFALAMTACLVAVIGLPAAFIVMRDGNSPIFQASPPPPAAETRQEAVTQNAVAPEAPPAQSEAKRGSTPPPVTALVAQKQDSVATPAANKPADELAGAEPATMGYVAAAPPPPPPPPPPAPMLAEKSVGGAASNGVVVTGSRIPQPNVSNREENALARAQTADASAAADWVLKDASYASFLKRLQGAIRGNDRSAVIKLIAFPLRVNFSSGSRRYRDAGSVRADYDRIFTPKVTEAILGQRFDQLFGRDQGLMIGNGAVWFDHVCTNTQCSPPGPVRITAVNP
jgi:hypothetical protein